MAYLQVRSVPEDWKHPKDENGRYIALLSSFSYEVDQENWEELFDRCILQGMTREEARLYVNRNHFTVDPKDYMPKWDEDKLTHFQIYEDTSEGTPVSPVMSKKEWSTLYDAFM